MRPLIDTLARLATDEKGLVTREELLAGGLSPEAVKRAVRAGLLLPEHRGVYRVGHRAPSVEATYLAAVRAAGPGAVLSGRAAAYLYGLLRGVREPPAPEVTAPRNRRITGVTVHRARRPLDPRDVTEWHGIPATTIPRTLVDVAAGLTPGELARACHEAQAVHRVRPEAVEAVLRRRPTAKGAATLRAVLHGDVHVTLTRLESRFLERVGEAGLPLPQTNRQAGGRYVDCRWPDHNLTVELDSYRYHHTRHAWEQDRRRERDAYARGDHHRRYTWHDVHEDPAAMLHELTALLAQ